jgi:hypothetical protein
MGSASAPALPARASVIQALVRKNGTRGQSDYELSAIDPELMPGDFNLHGHLNADGGNGAYLVTARRRLTRT